MRLNFGKIPDEKNARVYELLGVLIGKIETGSHPLKIGMSGYIGKTTLAKSFAAFLGRENCVVIETDDYIRERAYRRPRGLTGATLDGMDLQKARRDLSDLLEGKTIRKPVYNHSTGEVLPDVEVAPKKIIIVTGNATYYPELGVDYDIGYFIRIPEAEEERAVKERAARSSRERGYNPDAALEWERVVLTDFHRLVEQRASVADLLYEIEGYHRLRLIEKSARVERLLNTKK